jgi:hypothetical protein
MADLDPLGLAPAQAELASAQLVDGRVAEWCAAAHRHGRSRREAQILESKGESRLRQDLHHARILTEFELV